MTTVNRNWRRVGGLLLAVALLGGCGGDGGGEGASAETVRFSEDLCDVLTAEDLALVGPLDSTDVDVGEGGAPTVFCTYSISDPITSVSVYFYGGLLGDPAEQVGFIESGDYEEVQGLGVAAARSVETRTLEVWTEQSVRIEFIGLGLDDEDDVLVALAEAALSRLDDHLGE